MHFLQSCTALHSLVLEENPIAETDDYRQQVVAALPQLSTLDDTPVGEEPSPPSPPSAPHSPATPSADATPPPPLPRSAPLPPVGSSPPTAREFGPANCEAPASVSDPRTEAESAERSARRAELRLIRDGIKYTDALRAFDVATFEALALPSPSLLHATRPQQASPPTSSAASAMSAARTYESTSTHASRGFLSSRGQPKGAWLSPRPPSTGSSSAHASRPFTASLASGSSRAVTASSRGCTPHADDDDDGSSLLTFGDGVALCGNPTAALRAKRRGGGRPAEAEDAAARGGKGGQPGSAGSADALGGVAAGLGGLGDELAGLDGGLDGGLGAVDVGRGVPIDAESRHSQMLAELRRFKLAAAIDGSSAPPDGSADGATPPGSDEECSSSAEPQQPPQQQRAASAAREVGGGLEARRRRGYSLASAGAADADVLILDVPSSPSSSPHALRPIEQRSPLGARLR